MPRGNIPVFFIGTVIVLEPLIEYTYSVCVRAIVIRLGEESRTGGSDSRPAYRIRVEACLR